MDLRNGERVIKAASFLILTDHTGPINHELSSHALFLNLPSQASMNVNMYTTMYIVHIVLTSN